MLERVERTNGVGWFVCEQQMMPPRTYYCEGEHLLSGYWTFGSWSLTSLCTEGILPHCRHCCLDLIACCGCSHMWCLSQDYRGDTEPAPWCIHCNIRQFHIALTVHLTGFAQYVDCPTRENNLLYAKVKEAHSHSAIPPLGRHDHNLVFLQLSFKCTAAVTGTTMVDCITDCINFCRDTVIPVRTVCCFPNKPWINSKIKEPLNQKKEAFRDGDREKLKSVQ